jgi:hypothetical protein
VYQCLLTHLSPPTRPQVAASRLPLSIMIVGIGSEDFSNMEMLDADRRRLGSAATGYAERDIVQFVAFNQFARDGNALAAALLAEMPGQLLSYMRWVASGLGI